MRFKYYKSILKNAGLTASILLMASGAAFAQQQVNLTAAGTSTTLPDGNTVPMWGYSCGTAVSGSTATCAGLNPAAALAGTWSPVVITVPTGQDLQINLTNSLSFGAAPNNIPTSLVIVGQLGGGLGSTAKTVPSPDHTNAQPVTWPIAGDAPGVPVTGVGIPPIQGNRVQSFSTEVAVGTPMSLCWGVCGAGKPALKPGTYLIESGTHPSIQGPMGLYGILVVTTAPSGATAGTAYGTAGAATAVSYNADVPLLFSEIDPVQNTAVQLAALTPGFKETTVWSGLYGGCGNPLNADGTANSTYGTCYPPAVNYTPLYYLINGRGFDKTNASRSLFAAAAGTTGTPPVPVTSGISGNVLVRLVNAGLRMHVPSIVGAQTGTAVAPALPPAGFALIAEDGNPLPGVARVQSEVFMPAGKTNDVLINVPASGGTALPIFDRELSLSGNAIGRDAGMLAYISVNGAALPTTGAFSAAATTAQAIPDTYKSVINGQTLVVSDPAKGVINNDINVYGVALDSTYTPVGGTVTLNPDGTFSFAATAASGSFRYCANGTTTICATVTLAAATVEASSGITCAGTLSFTSNVSGHIAISAPGVLSGCKDAAGYPLKVDPATVVAAGATIVVGADGGFTANGTAASASFTFQPMNSQGTHGAAKTVSLTFPTATGLNVTVLDGTDKVTPIGDYRWLIEEDRTFYVDPNCTTNPPAAGCPGASTAGFGGVTGIVPTFGTNFHTSYMPVVAAGCTGLLSCESGQTMFDPTTGTHINAVCDVGNGVCRPDPAGTGLTPTFPSAVHLDPTKRYYLTIFPGDAGNPFASGNLSADCTNGVASASNPSACGHGMGGAPLRCTITPPATNCAFAPVTVLTQPDPFPPSKLSVFVFEDDFPLNGEHDGGGGIDVLSPNEPGLGGFNITLFDDAGGTGDATGQMTYDMFNQPLVNSLAGSIDPATGLDACPISKISRIGPQKDANGNPIPGTYDNTQTGITGTIITCPKVESDGHTLSPLAGQAVVANLMPGRYGVVATPGADRIARSEEWLQTNTLDGQKAHDSFLRIGEPSFFQEFGPAGYHVTIGFANPAIINSRKAAICGGTDPNAPTPGAVLSCTNTVTGFVSTERMSRTPDERLYGSGDNSSFAFTQCYVSLGDADAEDFAFTKCDAGGHFTFTGIPDGDWRITVFDQWNDMLVDGLSTPVRLGVAGSPCPGTGSTQHSCNMGEIAMNQWQANIYTSTFFDANGNGVRDANETGLTLVPTNIRFRDGSYSNFNNTDLSGNAGFNEIFPLFSWYVIETDWTRYKNTGTHVVYDAGGPADGTCTAATAPCGSSNIAANLANTFETVSVPTALRVPGAVYCKDGDCTGHSITSGPASSDAPSNCSISPTTGATSCTGTPLSTARIDPPWVTSEAWQGFSGQNSFIEFGKAPYAAGENGGIHGEVIYASTRPFDDPQLLLHTSWTPDVPGVTINLYQVGTAADGSQSLTLVDTTKTSSWDDWAQGFYPGSNKPYMNCPGQLAEPTSASAGDMFFFTLFNQPMYLDLYNSQHGGAAVTTIPNNSQYKCYDGMHNWNQVQPAPYDGMYQFPSIVNRDSTTGAPANMPGSANPAGTGSPGSLAGSNCTVCVANPTDGTPMLPRGQYVVEMIMPPGYELVKEEDKNILIGDNYIAPVTQQFPGLGSAIYIMPDQASVSSQYNANQGSLSGFNPTNAQNSTQAFGRISSLPSHEGDTGSVETFWPCVGEARIVPDYISLFPQSAEVAPFAGAKRNLCDRKLVTLDDQTSALAKFWVFTSTHVAAHFTGVITDDYTSEFDPFSPQFGEKFSPANLPVAIKDWTGAEVSRVYADQWGTYNGITYSSWEVNPPNPTGYAPTMMVTCMNDPGTGATPDPLYNPAYSQFCYEIPFMPGQTQYMDTPVVPTSAFAGAGYNNPDCDYPDTTPAVSEVDGGTPTAIQAGPWVSTTGVTLHIYALGTVPVNNYGYSGPAATAAPFNAKTVTRRYSFGTATGTVALVGSDNVARPLTGVVWGDSVITGGVPTGLPDCPVQQQTQYGAPSAHAQCGQLVITAANGKQSIDTVTVTIGGKPPTHVAATASVQAAIDAAHPGDMLMLDPTTRATAATASTTFLPAAAAVHQELLLMWKPVRLQGVGAVASVINANTHPAGKLDPWRRQVNCLFGLAINGQPMSSSNPFDPAGVYKCGAGANGANFNGHNTTLVNFAPYVPVTHVNPQVDRLPLEAVVGWDASQNGNMAELLQEPSLMGALEGAGVTVLAKGMAFPPRSDPFGTTASAIETGTFPAGTTLLTGSTSSNGGRGCNNGGTNPFPSNFYCNPSSIDGVTITNSSQGGGGIFVHGWGHNIQIANNRVINNAGTLGGGVNIGQGEFPGAYTVGGTNADPGSCQSTLGLPTGTQEQYCFDVNVNMHHNMISKNSSTGDELFSATPAGAGGVNVCNGSDYYKFNYNWLCGNLSTGDGGGLAHIGFNYNGDIEHNTVLFNQSTNPTIATNGGGLLIMGAPDVDPTCGATTDQDCLNPTPVAPSDGVGPGLVINANLIQGNAAESGSGGGLRLQNLNGTDVLTFPTLPNNWYRVQVTNNIIANNVAGWDGGGISLQDALVVNIINNTIMSNDTTASSGVLFNTLGAPLASSQGPCPGGRNPDGSCSPTNGVTTSTPQPAGLVTIQNSANLMGSLPATITCPAGHYTGATANNAECRTVSYPELYNNVMFQNRVFDIKVGALGVGTLNQQNVVTLAPTLNQPQTDAVTPNGNGQVITGGTGACVSTGQGTNGNVAYWDLGVRGDTGPDDHSSGVQLAPAYSVLTDVSAASGYSGAALHNTGANPTVVSQYCNGSRVPPENGGLGYDVPPGIADATVPNPIFNLTPAATVDEGNNWINISWGPLTLSNPSVVTTTGTAVAPLGNYGPALGSPAINYILSTAGTYYAAAPSQDFFGTNRKTNNAVDAGAVEFAGTTGGGPTAILSVTGGPLSFGNGGVSSPATTTPAQTLTLHNTGTVGATGIGVAVATTSSPTTPNQFARPAGLAGGTCGATLAAGATCTINVTFAPTSLGAKTGTVTIAANVAVTGSPVVLTGTGVAPVISASLTPTSKDFGTVTRGCGLVGTGACPAQTFTLTNTGNVTLTGIAQGAVSGTNASDFPVVRLTSSCGPAGNGQLFGQTTLAPGAMCLIIVRFAPPSGDTVGAKGPAMLSVTDAGGTQTSTPLAGTAQ
jgi:hypothetical protein